MTTRFGSEQQSWQQAGPPLVLLATISLLLLIAGLALSAALGGVIPSHFGDATAIQDYFAQTSDAVRASAVCLFGSAIPLAIYAATASSRLRTLGVTAPGATIALAGGLIWLVVAGLRLPHRRPHRGPHTQPDRIPS